MIEKFSFEERLGPGVRVDNLAKEVASHYGLGNILHVEPIAVGFEDFNVKLECYKGTWFVKVFNKSRSIEEIERYVAIVSHALDTGVNHPQFLKGQNGRVLFKSQINTLYAVCMQFIEGKTFYQTAGPSDQELETILQEVLKIHQVDYKPDYLFDAWAVPNIEQLYMKVRPNLSRYDIQISAIVNEYKEIDINRLEKCLVHGDVIKSNVIISKNSAYILDFSVANVYPKIQDLAVISANLLAQTKDEDFSSRVDRVVSIYEKQGGTLGAYDKNCILVYAQAAVAMEFMGSIYYADDGTEDEAEYWLNLAKNSLSIM